MSQALFDLTGKTAMVTGGTRGLGEVSAMALAKAGADVAVCVQRFIARPGLLARQGRGAGGVIRHKGNFPAFFLFTVPRLTAEKHTGEG